MLFFASTVFLSAFLIFQIQPVIAKLLLPFFGGSAMVWISAMLFFQAVLLLGYLYSHLLINRVSRRVQPFIHLVLLTASCFFLGLPPSFTLIKPDSMEPIGALMLLLSASVGMPYFMLSTTSPLLQAWHAEQGKSESVFRLFAVSNIASLAGLVSYPFVIEPLLPLRQQSVIWSALYYAFAAISAVLCLRKINAARIPISPVSIPGNRSPLSVPVTDRLWWIALPLCSSMLFLSVTRHITNDFPMPLLWILPLAIYLLTFSICFASRQLYEREQLYFPLLAALAIMSYGFARWGSATNLKIVATVFSIGLFLCCFFCHGELVKRRPGHDRITSYNLHIALGGLLGSCCVVLAAPRLFAAQMELMISFLLCAALALAANFSWRGTAGWLRNVSGLAAAAIIIWCGAVFYHKWSEGSLYSVRNFYGSHAVLEEAKNSPYERRVLRNGSIIHGVQLTRPGLRAVPLAYYADVSGLGAVFSRLHHGGPIRIGAVGLGVGTVAAYGKPGDEIIFYELDPEVERIARKYFYYLPESNARVSVTTGDGRLSLEKLPAMGFDILIVDAFSGDYVPVHLLTRQAFELYSRHVRTNGVLAIHLSSQFFDISGVAVGIAGSLNRKFVTVETGPGVKRSYPESEFPSNWLFITDDDRLLSDPALLRHAIHPAPSGRLWTDDYSNLLQIMR